MPNIIRLSPDCFLDMDNQTVKRGGRTFRWTDIEYRILSLLVQHAEKPVNTKTMKREIWGVKNEGDRENLRVHIHKIRMRIEPEPGNPVFLLTVFGKGYMLLAPTNHG